MRTEDLIAVLARDARLGGNLALSLKRAIIACLAVTALAFFLFVGLRPDIGIAVGSIRFLWKFVITICLAISAGHALFRVGRPGQALRACLAGLFAPAALVLLSVIAELISTPQDVWWHNLVGKNSLLCLSIIPGLSIVPLAIIVHAMRLSAPESPALAGALAGLSAAGISATFYAANCTDDSPLFVMTWYPLSILTVTLAGALLGKKYLRW